MSWRTSVMTSSPAWRAASSLAGSSAGMPLRPAGERPRNSSTVDIVLAVNWPPHAPGPGAGRVLDLVQLLEADLAGPIRADRLEHGDDRRVALALVDARVDRAVVEDDRRDIEACHGHRRAGHRLVAADEADETVEQVAAATSSMESAMTSRLTSEAFMPSVPIVTPSETAIVLNSIGVPPAARMPSLTNSASRRWL